MTLNTLNTYFRLKMVAELGERDILFDFIKGKTGFFGLSDHSFTIFFNLLNTRDRKGPIYLYSEPGLEGE